MYGSLKLSYDRLKRDVGLQLSVVFRGRENICMTLLWLLSKAEWHNFSRKDVIEFCQDSQQNVTLLPVRAVNGLPTPSASGKEAPKKPDDEAKVDDRLSARLEILKQEPNVVYDCLLRLVQAAFLIEDENGSLTLNELTMAWAVKVGPLLINQSQASHQQKMMVFGHKYRVDG